MTDVSVRALSSAKKVGDHLDGATPGLFLRIGKRSSSWTLVYKVAGEGGKTAAGRALKGKARRLHLGDLRRIGLAEARRKAVDALILSTSGGDPRHPTISVGQDSNSPEVDWLIDAYLAEYVVPSLRSAQNARWEFDRHWRPYLGSRPYKAVTRAELNSKILSIARSPDHGPGAALEARRWVVALFGWAVRRDLIGQNPASGLVTRNDLRQSPTDLRPRDRLLTLPEVRAVYRAAARMRSPWGPLAQVLLLTLARRGEFAKARWPWLNVAEKILEVPGANHKNGAPKTIPLCTSALAICEALPKGTRGAFMFSTTCGEKAVFSFADAYANELRKLSVEEFGQEMEHFTLHDFRRAGATHLTAKGVNSEVVELLLGHSIPGVRGVYMKHKFLAERRDALRLWEELIHSA